MNVVDDDDGGGGGGGTAESVREGLSISRRHLLCVCVCVCVCVCDVVDVDLWSPKTMLSGAVILAKSFLVSGPVPFFFAEKKDQPSF